MSFNKENEIQNYNGASPAVDARSGLLTNDQTHSFIEYLEKSLKDIEVYSQNISTNLEELKKKTSGLQELINFIKK